MTPDFVSRGGGVLGVGVDVVDLDAFARALAEPGTRFARVFSAAERRQCAERAAARGATGPDALTPHLAARWAAKEAVVKAWSGALHGRPPPLAPEELRWAEIETLCDAWGRPAVRLGREVARLVASSVGEDVDWQLSLSHDGPVATAFVVLARG